MWKHTGLYQLFYKSFWRKLYVMAIPKEALNCHLSFFMLIKCYLYLLPYHYCLYYFFYYLSSKLIVSASSFFNVRIFPANYQLSWFDYRQLDEIETRLFGPRFANWQSSEYTPCPCFRHKYAIVVRNRSFPITPFESILWEILMKNSWFNAWRFHQCNLDN